MRQRHSAKKAIILIVLTSKKISAAARGWLRRTRSSNHPPQVPLFKQLWTSGCVAVHQIEIGNCGSHRLLVLSQTEWVACTATPRHSIGLDSPARRACGGGVDPLRCTSLSNPLRPAVFCCRSDRSSLSIFPYFLLFALHLLRPICPLTCHTSVGILDKRWYDETKSLGLIATLEVFGRLSSISVCSSQTLAATARFLPLGTRWRPPLAARQPARAQAPRLGPILLSHSQWCVAAHTCHE